mmetsp:Transcript_30818/g.90021  ORF Transcript_30818/g.90021 Transcript_30818/m.90021 type:complete len:245 (+) Transcript_30818:1387-2121(+)
MSEAARNCTRTCNELRFAQHHAVPPENFHPSQTSRTVSISSTLGRHEPIKKNHNRHDETDHVAHVLGSALLEHGTDSLQRPRQQVPGVGESITHIVQQRVLLPNLIANVQRQSLEPRHALAELGDPIIVLLFHYAGIHLGRRHTGPTPATPGLQSIGVVGRVSPVHVVAVGCTAGTAGPSLSHWLNRDLLALCERPSEMTMRLRFEEDWMPINIDPIKTRRYTLRCLLQYRASWGKYWVCKTYR